MPTGSTATAGRTASNTDTDTDTNTGTEAPRSESTDRSCPTQAVIRLADPLGGIPVLGISGPPMGATPFDQTVTDLIDALRCHDADGSRFRQASICRWDRGFEPSSILGTGLRSLAPPHRAQAIGIRR